MRHRVHVNQHNIKANVKGASKPVLTVKTYKENIKANEAVVMSSSGEVVGRFIYKPDNPLSCGAKVWFETENDSTVVVK